MVSGGIYELSKIEVMGLISNVAIPNISMLEEKTDSNMSL